MKKNNRNQRAKPSSVLAHTFDVQTVLLHGFLFVFPILVDWLLIQNANYIRNRLPHLIPDVIPARQRLLEEILSQPPPTRDQLEIMFSAYANIYHIDKSLLQSIAYCESRYNPAAVNGRHAGMYQFNPTTWQAVRKRMGYDPDINLRFDAEEAVKTAAFKLAEGGSGAWAVCSAKYYNR